MPGIGAQIKVVIVMMMLVMATVIVTVTVMIMITTCMVAQVCDSRMYCQTKHVEANLFSNKFVAEEHPEKTSSLLDALVSNGANQSNPRHIRENNALDVTDDNQTATAAADPTTTSKGTLLELSGDQLNNDFEYQYFEDAVRKLGVERLIPVKRDIGPRMLKILGIPQGGFHPDQVQGSVYC